MKLSLLLVPLLAVPGAAGPRASSPFSFDLPSLQALVQRVGPASVGELLDEFAKADRARQREILEELPMRTGGSSWEDQSRLVWALRDAARSTQTPSEVRAKALQTLGRCARQMTQTTAAKEAVEVLIEEAKKDGVDDTGLQPYALMGIIAVADRLPFGDQAGREDLVEALLDIRARRKNALEVTLALQGLSTHFSAYGASYIWTKLGSRIEQELVRAAENNGSLEGAYSESTLTTEGRYFWIRSLWYLAWTQAPGEYDLRQRCAKGLRDISNRETDTNLRMMARLYAERLNG